MISYDMQFNTLWYVRWKCHEIIIEINKVSNDFFKANLNNFFYTLNFNFIFYILHFKLHKRSYIKEILKNNIKNNSFEK